MTQTYRTDDLARWGSGQGFNLTAAQVDINFWDLVQRMIAQEARPDPSAGIDYFEIVGINMYVHMTDATVLGPYELPVATFQDRGEWQPETIYSKMDTFSVNGGLYVVIFDHTSELTFDPGANDGAGHDYYQLMIQTPGSALPSGGAVGMALLKATETDYSTMWGKPDALNVWFESSEDSALTSSNVAEALEELEAMAASFSGDAVDVVYDPTTSGLTATNVQAAIDELATAGAGGAVGRQTIWIPAAAMIPRTTNGPALNTVEMTTNKNMVRTLDFDATTAEYAQFDIAMPKSWDEGDLYFKVFWSHAATTTNFGVTWQMDMVEMGASFLDAAFVGPQTITDTGGTTNALLTSDESPAMSLGPDEGNPVAFRISRKPADAGDTLVIDARLHGVQVFYTTDAATDD